MPIQDVDFPKDIMDKAHLIWQDANTVDGVFTGDGQSSKYIPIIARAILAERERCAAISEKAFIHRQDADGRMAFAAGAEIAAAIREGKPVGGKKA